MREFGAVIVASQTAQIQQMRTWLALWHPGEPTDVDYQPMMRDLSGLSGDALDRAFLEDMTVHHMMAVMMSQQLLARTWRTMTRSATSQCPSATSSTPRSSRCASGSPAGSTSAWAAWGRG